MRPYNILYTTSVTTNHTGKPITMRKILSRLDKARFRAHLLCPPKSALREALAPWCVSVTPRKTARLTGGEIGQFARDMTWMCRFLRQRHIHLVHTHGGTWRGAHIMAARLMRVPLVIHIHTFMPVSTWREDFAPYLATRIVGVSEAAVRDPVRHPRFAHKTLAIVTGVETELYCTGEQVRDELGGANGDRLVGIVGQVCERKGTRFFIEMIPHVLKQRNCVKFLVIGRDATGEEGYTEQMKSLARALGVENHVYFTGFRSDIPKVMQSLDVLAAPSLEESLGVVVMEAMAAGACVVASNVDGIPEMVNRPEVGTLVPPRDPQALAEAVARYLSDEALRRRTGEQARRRVEQCFSVNSMVRRIEELYLELIGGRTQK